MYLTENLQEKWQPVLEHPELPKIEDSYRRAVTTVILENQEKALREDKNFLEGLNIFKGQVTYKAVADTFGFKYTSPNKLLG